MHADKAHYARRFARTQRERELRARAGVTSVMETCSFMALSELMLKVNAVFDAGVAGSFWRQVPFGSAVVVRT